MESTTEPGDELMTAATFSDSFQASLASLRLTDEGIDNYIFDDNIVSLQPLYSQLAGGIKLKVKATDLARTQMILNEINTAPITTESGEVITCPRCGSQHVRSATAVNSYKSVLAFVVGLLLFVFPFFLDRVNHCQDCGKVFEKSKA